MAGHNLEITLKSGNQVENITVSDEAVDFLMPGTPQQTIKAARKIVRTGLLALLSSKRRGLQTRYVQQNITMQNGP